MAARRTRKTDENAPHELNKKLVTPGGNVKNDPEAQDKRLSGAKSKALKK